MSLITMSKQLVKQDRTVRVSRRFAGIFLLGGIALLTPGWLQAQVQPTIELSPVVSRYPMISAADPSKIIAVSLTLPLSDLPGAKQYVQSIYSPWDPLYRKYLTPDEFAAKFGANAADYAVLKDWANANGLEISQESIARTLLTVRGTVSQFQTLFKTQLNTYRSPDGQEFISASIKPAIPNAIAGKVAGVIGLTNSIQYAPQMRIHKVLGEDINAAPIEGQGTGPGGAFYAADLRQAYSIPDFGDVRPQTIGVFEEGGFTMSDVTTYLKANKLKNPGVEAVKVNGYDGSVNDTEGEAVADIEMLIGINPHLAKVLVYEAAGNGFPVDLANALAQVADDDRVSVLSISYGLDEAEQTDSALSEEGYLTIQLASEGIAVFASSGDEGAYGRTGVESYPALLNVADPGSQEYITCVGGTSLYVDSTGNYQSETAWNTLSLNAAATGGGVSSYWTIPFYQNPGVVSQNGGSTTFRNVPDVAAIGDPYTGVAVYSKVNGGWLQIGGTSISTPIWASYLSILNAASEDLTKSRIGFANWIIYNMNGGSPSSVLYDITSGFNGDAGIYGTPGYNAGPNYDNCTGLGSMSGPITAYNFLTTEGGYRATGHEGKAPPSAITDLVAKPGKTSVKLTWKPAQGATGYVVLVLSVRSFGSQFARLLLTKQTELEVTKLEQNQINGAWVAALNKAGSSSAFIGFETK